MIANKENVKMEIKNNTRGLCLPYSTPPMKKNNPIVIKVNLLFHFASIFVAKTSDTLNPEVNDVSKVPALTSLNCNKYVFGQNTLTFISHSEVKLLRFYFNTMS